MRKSCWWVFAAILCLSGVATAAGSKKLELDPPPGVRQKPYSPGDGQVVQVTPPPFIWVPVAQQADYILQISTSQDFRDPRTFRGIKTSVFVPGETLPPGRWYWRYGVHTPSGDVFGRPRPFTVPQDARPFPFPDFTQVLSRIPESRPRLFFPGERLERVRQQARGDLRADVDRLLARCRAEIGGEIVPEPPLPKTGPDHIRVMRTTRPSMDEMEDCALAYLITGDKTFGQEAKRRILHFFAWNPNGPTGLWGYDEPAMWVMMRGSRAYDWTYDLFTPEERGRIEPVMKERARQFYVHLKDKLRFETNPYESHAGRMPGFLGEAALCFAHEWPEARDWLEYATLLYYTSYPAWGGDDGGWQEGPGYWSAYMSFALHFVIALRHATGVDLMNKPFFRQTPYYALYTATPYHEHRPFGDGAAGNPRGLADVLYAFSTLLEDPYLRWYPHEASRTPGSSLLTLATYDPAIEPRRPDDLPLTDLRGSAKGLPAGRVFPSVGLAALHTALGDRDRDITFLLRSSPYGSVSHGHADQNAFVIEAFGRGLALATGYYPWYGSPHHHEWTRATCSVNSILVDHQGQERRSWTAVGRIVAFEMGKDYDYIAAEAGSAYGDRLERFRRHVVHVRPGSFVMMDDLKASRPATYQWLLHAYDRIGVEGQFLHVRRDPAVMDVNLLLPRQLSISQTDRYVPEPEDKNWENTWHLTASTIEPSVSERFLTVMIVRHEQSQAAVPQVKLIEEAGAVGVAIVRSDGSKDLVAFRTQPGQGEVQCGELSSRAGVFAGVFNAGGSRVRSGEWNHE